MAEYMFLILKMNFIAALMIAAAVILGKLTKGKYSSKWKYCMWLAIMVFLLIPVDFSRVSPVQVKITRSGYEKEIQRENDAFGEAPVEKIKQEPVTKKRVGTEQLLTGGFIIWVAGIILFGAVRGLRCFYSLYSVRRWSYAVDDEKVLGLYFFLCKRKHIRKPPRLLRCDKIKSPMLAGLLHPGMYLLKEKYTVEELEFIFSHELSHYIRRDLWYKMLMMAVMTIYWFNPALYWMQHEANKDIENLCDGKMVAHYSSKEKSLYGQLLLKVAATQNHVPYLAVSLNDSKQVFKERILYMKNIRAMKEKIFPAVLLSAVMFTSQFLVGCSMEGIPQKAEVAADAKEQKKEVISKPKESNKEELSRPQGTKKEENATGAPKSPEVKSDKKTEPSDTGKNINDVEPEEPEYKGTEEENQQISDDSEQWSDQDEPELTGEQKTLYDEGGETYSGVFIYRGNDGYWYDGKSWQYSDLGGGQWLCTTDGSRMTEEKPEFSPEKAYSQAVIADESGQNQKTIYHTGGGQWQTEDGEVWEVLGGGDVLSPDGELWQVLE